MVEARGAVGSGDGGSGGISGARRVSHQRQEHLVAAILRRRKGKRGVGEGGLAGLADVVRAFRCQRARAAAH